MNPRFFKRILLSAAFLPLFIAGLTAQTVVFTPTNITCHNAADGKMNIQVTDGSSQYRYVCLNLNDLAKSDSFGPTSNLNYTFLNRLPDTDYFFIVRDITTGLIIGFLHYPRLYINPAPLNATVGGTQLISCYGSSTGSIIINGATGGSEQFDFTINGGSGWQPNSNFNALPAGVYNVQMRDRNNTTCFKVLNAALAITQNQPLDATVNVTNPLCFGQKGVFTITNPTGGSATGTYQYRVNGSVWSTNSTYSNLNQGTYHVEMRQLQIPSCIVSLGTVTITEPSQLTTVIAINKGLTCFEGSDAELKANVSGGTGPYTYDWYVYPGPVSIGQHTQIATGISQGRYHVKVTDANGCGPRTAELFFTRAALPVNLKDSIPPEYFYDGAEATTACEGQTNGSITLNAHGGITPYKYSITTGGASGYQTENQFTGLPAGSYQPWVMDKRGCKKTGDNVIVGTTANSPVSIAITANPAGTICPGTSVLFTATPVNGGTSPAYQWYRNGSAAGSNQPTYTYIPSDGDQVYAVLTSDIRCTTGNPATSNTITINHNPVTAINSHPSPITQCEGTNATFSVTATGVNLTYQWRKNGTNITGAISSTYTINNIKPSDAGNYSVRVHSDCGTDVVSNNALLTVNPATAITAQPQPLTQCVGTNATFTVAATGTNLTYQWRFNGVAISGANGSSYTINNIDASDAGDYSVLVHSDCGSDVISDNAALVVNPITIITGQPVSLTRCAGTNATFTVTATGTNLTYQWRKNGTNISNATGSSYSIPAVTASHAGDYTVIVTGDCGAAVTSTTATLVVNPVTAITAQPQPLTQCVGTNATFTVAAAGTNLTYQWRFNGVAISGANGSSYTINNIDASDAGDYSVLVHSDCGSDVISDNAALVVNPITIITGQPVSLTRCAGTNATFTVTATGTNLTYQWRKNGTNISNATGSSYSIPAVTASDAGDYTVVVTGDCGAAVTSTTATLVVNPVTAITAQPQPLTQCVGTNATFTVAAAGTNLTYQWRHNGVAISGANGSSYTINNIDASDAGDYSVLVHSDCGSDVISDNAALVVNPATVITAQPVAVIQCAGTNATFTVTAAGTNLIYQWRKDGVDIPNSNSSSYIINNINDTHTGSYSVLVQGDCGPDVLSNSVTLTLHPATVITAQPAGSVECPGNSITFTVVADGAGLSYQWRKNGINISGAIESTYTIDAIAAGDAGDYTVVVTGTCGAVTSEVATLVVNTAPVITVQPQPATRCPGTDITFSVSASGLNLSYVWRKNGMPIIPAETGQTLVITNIDAADAGSYDVVITNPCGDIASVQVALTVAENVVINTHPSDLDICEGGDATFSVNAAGTDINYQWRKDGIDITGETSPDLILNAINLSDAGEYDVVITGLCGSLVSEKAELVVYPLTTGQIDEADMTVCAGENIEFNVSGSGHGSLFYQWQKYISGVWTDIFDDGKYSGTFSPSLEIINVEIPDSGLYRVQVSAGCGSVYTEPVRLDVSLLIATIGTPAPFLINSETTKIEAGIEIRDHYLIFDLGFALVAPDGTEVMLKSPIDDPFVYNNPVNIDAVFTNMPPALGIIDYSLPLNDITGTFGSEGDWSVLNGKDPSNGAWQIRVYDQNRVLFDTDGILTHATLTFTDTDNDGNTAVVTYNSGDISLDIQNPVAGELRATSYVVPIRLNTSCWNSEDARAVVTVEGGVAPYTYSWSGPTTEEQSAEVDLGVGTYTVTVTDAIGCTAQASVEVTAPPAILFDDVRHTDALTCYGASEGIIRAKASGGRGGIQYTLLPGNLPSSVADSGVFTGLTAGNWTLRATDINGCSRDTVIIITENSQITLNVVTVPVNGDQKGSITISAAGGVSPYQYSIDNGTTLQDNGNFTDLDAGIYQLYVQDAAGCFVTGEVNLNVELLNVAVTVHDVSCYGLADGSFYIALIDGTGPYTLTGSFTDPLTLPSGAFSFTGQTAGTYDVKIEDSEGSVFMDIIEINEPSSINASESITHPNCSYSTDGAIELEVTGGTGQLTFAWDDGAITEDRADITAGSYELRITDENGCFVEYDYDLIQQVYVYAYAGPDMIVCPGDSVQLDGSSGDSVLWSSLSTFDIPWISDQKVKDPYIITDRDIEILYTVYSNGCAAQDSISLESDGPYGVSIIDVNAGDFDRDTEAYLLEGETVRLGLWDEEGHFGGADWYPAENLTYPYEDSRIVDVTPPGSMYLTIWAITANGCREKDSINLIVARTLNIYNAFSPNGDGVNDTWVIEHAIEYGDRINVKVFNRWGEPIYESKGYGGSNEWDGNRNGKMLPVGSYYYIINVKDGKSDPYTGTVTILR